jgi:hypothetical protein
MGGGLQLYATFVGDDSAVVDGVSNPVPGSASISWVLHGSALVGCLDSSPDMAHLASGGGKVGWSGVPIWYVCAISRAVEFECVNLRALSGD